MSKAGRASRAGLAASGKERECYILWQNPGFVISRMQSHGGSPEVSAAIAQPGGETAMLPQGTKVIVLGNPVRCQKMWLVGHPLELLLSPNRIL